MPATTPNPGKFRQEGDGKFRFVRCELTNGQKVDLKRWREDGATEVDLLSWVDKRLVSGHTLSLKGQENGYMATLTGVRESSGHAGICLTARGSTPLNALFALQYKDAVLLKGKWEVVDWANELDL